MSAHHIPSRLSDCELIAEVKRLAGCEREATVELISHLAELDRRRLYLGAGHASLFTYCTEVLRLSEHAAFHRILAARKARQFPAIIRMLAEGSLNLTSVRLLAPYLTKDNHAELLDAASGQGKRELQKLLARRFPQPDVATSIRRLPAPRPAAEPADAPDSELAPTLGPGAVQPPTAAIEPGALPPAWSPLTTAAVLISPPLRRSRPVATPLAPNRYQITFTASEEMHDKLELARDLLRHAVPSGDPAAIIDRALTALVEELSRQKFAATDRPRSSRGARNGSRHLPADVKRSVWVRDLGRCAFVSAEGRRCIGRGFVEFHHVKPFAAGGLSTVANIELRCRAHNAHEADLYYGPRAPEGFVQEPAAAGYGS